MIRYLRGPIFHDHGISNRLTESLIVNGMFVFFCFFLNGIFNNNKINHCIFCFNSFKT